MSPVRHPLHVSHRIRTVEMHTAGEPLRVIVGGVDEPEGGTILEKRRTMLERHDRIRRLLMLEPRGHADMYGCLPVEPAHPDADFGVLFMHNEGYSTMCGHAVIALARLAVEEGWVPRVEPVSRVGIEAPCGLVEAWARLDGGRVVRCGFEGVAAFVQLLDAEVEVPGMGRVRYDLAYGGAFYAFVDSGSLGLELIPSNLDELVKAGMRIKEAVAGATPPRHPAEDDLSFLYGTIFVGPSLSAQADSRNVCIFAAGEVDRSPTGSGVSARMAIHRVRGELAVGESMRIESVLGTCFEAGIARDVRFEGLDAVIPTVAGEAFVTGRSEFLLDSDDLLGEGFLVR